MVSFTKSAGPLALLSLLPALAQAAMPPYAWRVTGLQASDQPVDPAQTGATPALHRLQFNITDVRQQATSFCSAGWANADFPQSLQRCTGVSGPTGNATFEFAVEEYRSSAAGGFRLALTERVVSIE